MNLVTNNEYIREMLEAMLARPEMYAQNPGSFEDQILLLMSMMADNVGMDLNTVQRDYEDFRKRLLMPLPTSVTMASGFSFNSPTSIQSLLGTFFKEFCTSHKLTSA